MSAYVLLANGTALWKPIAVATSVDRAIDLAQQAAVWLDGDGYHNIGIYEMDYNVPHLAVKVLSGYENGDMTARHVGTLERSRDNLNGVWKPA